MIDGDDPPWNPRLLHQHISTKAEHHVLMSPRCLMKSVPVLDDFNSTRLLQAKRNRLRTKTR